MSAFSSIGDVVLLPVSSVNVQRSPQINDLSTDSLRMGNCRSSQSVQVATGKLILEDGRLMEFSEPVKVSNVLQKNPTSFICNSDEMEFDDVVSAVNEDEELQPGQLYFALPLNRLKYPMQAEEMAALAVKASSALMKSTAGGGEKCGCRPKPLVFSADENGKLYRRVAAATSGERRGARRNRGGSPRKFTAMLTAIPE